MTAALADPPRSDVPVLVPVPPDRSDDDLDRDELGSRIVALAGRLAAATCRWLLLVARFDAAEGCSAFGLASTAHWLSFACGLSHRTALDHVRVARALVEFPELAIEMSAGRLSYTQVRAISRVPRGGETSLVTELVNVARHSTASQLETVVRGLRTVDDLDATTGDEIPQEYVTQSWTSESQWRCNARLDPERGALVQAALDAVAGAEGISRADALVRMSEMALAVLNDLPKGRRTLRGDELAAVVIHLNAADVPAETVAAAPRSAERTRDVPADSGDAAPRSAERGRPFARLADGPGLRRDVVERLLCAGRIRTAVHDERGNVRDLGRSHRVVSERQFRALLMNRHGHCAHPGCTSRTGLEAHHVRHWLYGGRTDLANLVLLCRAHHHGHHAGEFRISTMSDGRFRFRRRDGRLLEQRVDASRLGADCGPLERDYALVAPDAATSRWSGERLDRHYAISVLAQHRESPRRVADRSGAMPANPWIPTVDPWTTPRRSSSGPAGRARSAP